MRLAKCLLKMNIQRKTIYRLNFILLCISVAPIHLIQMVFSWFIAKRFSSFDGWNGWELIFLYGLMLTSYSIAQVFFRSFRYLEEMVINGGIVFDKGRVVLQKKVTDIGDAFGKKRFINITYKNDFTIDDYRIQILEKGDHKAKVVIDLDEISISSMMNEIMKHTDIIDINISSTPIEEIVKAIYTESVQLNSN